jgi:hypothetical protein
MQSNFFEHADDVTTVNLLQADGDSSIKVRGAWGNFLIHGSDNYTNVISQKAVLRPRDTIFDTMRKLQVCLFRNYRCICLALDRPLKEKIKSTAGGFISFLARCGLLNVDAECLAACKCKKCSCCTVVMSRLFVAVRASVFLIFSNKPNTSGTDRVFFAETVDSTWTNTYTSKEFLACGKPDAFVANGSEHWFLHTHSCPVLCQRPLTALILAIDILQHLPSELNEFGPFSWLVGLSYWHDCFGSKKPKRSGQCRGCVNFWLKLRWVDLTFVIASFASEHQMSFVTIARIQLDRYIRHITENSTRGAVNRGDVRICATINDCRSPCSNGFLERSCVTWELADVISDSCALDCWVDLFPLASQPHIQLALDLESPENWLLDMKSRIRMCEPTIFASSCPASLIVMPQINVRDKTKLDWTGVFGRARKCSYVPTILALCIATADMSVTGDFRTQLFNNVNWCKRLTRISTALDTGLINRAFGLAVQEGYALDWMPN